MPLLPAEPSRPDTVVLIHGLWLTSRSWEHWADRYRRAGFQVLTPAWPGMDSDVEALRRDSASIAELTSDQIVEHHERIIRDLPTPPIIMGHSFGGAFAQMLLDRGLGAAGVAIDSAPVKEWSGCRSPRSGPACRYCATRRTGTGPYR
ncbi:alpha/beta hydrolase [Plantactinospora veratri]